MGRKRDKAFADAIWLGDWDSAMSIYATGDVDINQPDRDTGFTWLHVACRMGNADFVRWLLDEGADVNAPAVRANDHLDDDDDENIGATPLLLTVDGIAGSQRKLVDMLLAAGADIHAVDSQGQNIVHRAIESKKMLALVLDLGADPDIHAHNGDTPLMRASLMGEKHAVTRFRKVGASEKGMLDVVFLQACYASERDKIDECLSSGANVNFQRSGTALSAAAGLGDIELMNQLLEAGADIDLANSNMPGGDFNPLLRAAYNGNADVVRFLLEAGADVTVSNQGYTPLAYAKLGKTEGHKTDRPWNEVVTMIRKAGKSRAPTLRGRVVAKGACDAVNDLGSVLPGTIKWSRFAAADVEIFESSRIDDAGFLQEQLPAMQAKASSLGFGLMLTGYSLHDVEPRLSDLQKDFANAAATSADAIFDAWEAERLGAENDSDEDEVDEYDWSNRQKVLANLEVIPAATGDPKIAFEPGHLVLYAAGTMPVPIMYQFGGWNSAPQPVEMVVVLQHWAEAYGAKSSFIGRDTLIVRLDQALESITEVRAAAREIGLFCDESDSAENDIRTATSNYWGFWWD